MPAITPIAYIHSDFTDKFGIPRQSGLVETLVSYIVFQPQYRDEKALKGLTDFSHIWLIWGFSANKREAWSATVRPPRLGGNERMGVFATRSPYRPNSLGLSAVKLVRVELNSKQGPILYVAGADLMNGTPIYDIKPYLPYADCIEGAEGGFAKTAPSKRLKVVIEADWQGFIKKDKLAVLKEVLAQDPRPAYQVDAGRVYGMDFAGCQIKFVVEEDVLIVKEMKQLI